MFFFLGHLVMLSLKMPDRLLITHQRFTKLSLALRSEDAVDHLATTDSKNG
jgi:hypothetical protein